jgi:hypothetical protein
MYSIYTMIISFIIDKIEHNGSFKLEGELNAYNKVTSNEPKGI